MTGPFLRYVEMTYAEYESHEQRMAQALPQYAETPAQMDALHIRILSNAQNAEDRLRKLRSGDGEAARKFDAFVSLQHPANHAENLHPDVAWAIRGTGMSLRGMIDALKEFDLLRFVPLPTEANH